MKHNATRTALLAVVVASMFATAPSASFAAPDLMVYPTRVVMTDRQRTAQVDLINNSQLQATYKISLVRKRMTENGEFQDVTVPLEGEKFADDFVKYSPRQVTLVPGATQTIRMMFKAPPNLPDGEYRSHLLFVKPPAAITELPDKSGKDAGTVSMEITANIGISIPVIIRHGNLEAKATIDPGSVKVSANGAKQVVTFTLARTGTRSVYGDVVIFRDNEKVAEGKGLALYTPNAQRKVALAVEESHHLKSGDKVRIVFAEKDQKNAIPAETSVLLP